VPVFGALPTTEPIGPKDYYLAAVPNTAIAASAVSYFAIGSIVMPFTGSLVADMYLRAVLQSGNSYLRVRLSNSGPAPSSYSDHGYWPTVNGVAEYRELAMTGVWNSVAKGTTVTFWAACDAGPGPQFTVICLGGFVHAHQ
jgi:hypothetical protein